MKNINNYVAKKYSSDLYKEIEPNIYQYKENFVTSLCFEQEPAYEEGLSAAYISQYPLEDILDHFCVYISDFYVDINTSNSKKCYLEFCGTSIEAVKGLRSIIGKHVYNKTIVDNGTEYIELIIE